MQVNIDKMTKNDPQQNFRVKKISYALDSKAKMTRWNLQNFILITEIELYSLLFFITLVLKSQKI